MIIDLIFKVFNLVVKPLLNVLPQYTPSFPTDNRFLDWLSSVNQVVPFLDVASVIISVAAGSLVALLALRFGTWLYRLIPGKFT